MAALQPHGGQRRAGLPEGHGLDRLEAMGWTIRRRGALRLGHCFCRRMRWAVPSGGEADCIIGRRGALHLPRSASREAMLQRRSPGASGGTLPSAGAVQSPEDALSGGCPRQEPVAAHCQVQEPSRARRMKQRGAPSLAEQLGAHGFAKPLDAKAVRSSATRMASRSSTARMAS